MPAFDRLLDDLAQETADLDRLLSASAWSRPVRDQVRHLARFDEAAVLALVDRRRFRTSVLTRPSDAELPAWFDLVRADLVLRLTITDPTRRVPWYGKDMDARTVATARLAETWAHGADIAAALGAVRAPTSRLRHVANLAVCAFAAKVPAATVFVDLTGPGGPWTWGPPDATDRVRGSALDFCHVVTRRRAVGETRLAVTGRVATQWLATADPIACPTPGKPKRLACAV